MSSIDVGSAECHSLWAIYDHFQGKTDEIEAALEAQNDQAGRMIDDLLWHFPARPLSPR